MPEEWSWARQMAQAFMESDFAVGMSGVDILDTLRGQGFGYRMTNFYDDLRRIRGDYVKVGYVKGLDPDEFVPRRYMAEVDLMRGTKKHWHQSESLRYRMEATFLDPETGEESTGYYALMSNQEMRKGDAERYVRDVFPWDAYGDGRELVGLDLVSLFHLKGTPY